MAFLERRVRNFRRSRARSGSGLGRDSGPAQHDRQEIEHGPALDDEAPVHEQLAEAQLGVEDHAALGPGVGEAHAHLLAGAVAENALRSARGHDRQRAAADEAGKNGG